MNQIAIDQATAALDIRLLVRTDLAVRAAIDTGIGPGTLDPSVWPATRWNVTVAEAAVRDIEEAVFTETDRLKLHSRYDM